VQERISHRRLPRRYGPATTAEHSRCTAVAEMLRMSAVRRAGDWVQPYDVSWCSLKHQLVTDSLRSCRCGAQFCYICGARWKTCQCAQWDEPRLMHRAAQIVDRNPNRRLFEPARVPHAQPRSRRLSAVSRTAVVAAARGEAAPSVNLFEPATPAESAWQSDFSDRSEWEEDWPVDDIETEPAPLVDAVQPAPANMPVPLTPAPVTPAHLVRATDAAQRQREQRIAEAIEHLRENHECSHNKWRWVRGRHQCEECLHVLREYIFECKQCSLQACNRCRRNRL